MLQPLLKDIFTQLNCKKPSLIRLHNELYNKLNTEVWMLRLDEIHPVISGNKIFKLIYFLHEAIISTHKKIITFGGAYSNHLAATAFACKQMNITSVGIIRGEKPEILSHTLNFCIANGMQLEFISRELYNKITENDFLEQLTKKYGEHVLVPEGGFSEKGKEGALLINDQFNNEYFSDICLPVGTATTFAGIIAGSVHKNKILGFGVLKNLTDITQRLQQLKIPADKNYSFIEGYHFGGYAKKTGELISFLNHFFKKNKIPLDFVYTGKMMYGVEDLIQKNYFPRGSKILCIHTGGLQGNYSLPKGMLVY